MLDKTSRIEDESGLGTALTLEPSLDETNRSVGLGAVGAMHAMPPPTPTTTKRSEKETAGVRLFEKPVRTGHAPTNRTCPSTVTMAT